MPPRRRGTTKRPRTLSTTEIERRTKAAAAKRRIVIELTDEQLKVFSERYRSLNPAEAAELIFTVKRRPISKLKIAGYSYSGDTCCV